MKMMHGFYVWTALAISMLVVALAKERIHSQNSLEFRPRSACKCECGQQYRKQRIVGGKKAQVSEFPWIAALTHAGTFYCGGALITPRHVLTAAHCLYGKRVSDITVTLGEHVRNARNKARVVKQVKDTVIHANFSMAKIQNDIALLELSSPVDITGPNITTACLPSRGGRNYSKMTGVVAGWGRISETSSTSQALRKVKLPLITVEECRKMGYPSYRITDEVFCAGSPRGKIDACQGDSGGPLHINSKSGSLEVIGLVSWGRGCGRPNYPGVYTRVDKYLKWITKNLKGHCLCNSPSTSHSYK